MLMNPIIMIPIIMIFHYNLDSFTNEFFIAATVAAHGSLPYNFNYLTMWKIISLVINFITCPI